MMYWKPNIKDKELITIFTLSMESNSIKIEHQKYTDVSDCVLIKAHQELWVMIVDNKLLVVKMVLPDENGESTINIIEVYIPLLHDQATDKARYNKEAEQRNHYSKQLDKPCI